MKEPKWIEPSESQLYSYEPPDFYPSLHLSGHGLSPKRFTEDTGITCTEGSEPGEIAVTGSWQGKKSPGGSAIIRPPKEIAPAQGLSWMVENVVGWFTHKFRKAHGIQSETMYLTVRFKGDCRIIFNGQYLRGLGFPAISLIVTCVQEEEFPNVPEKISRYN